MLRFAPSPTGDLHIGNLRVALINYIVAQQKKEDFIVRMEDIDKEKNIEGKDQEILDLLGLFGIEYSQIIYQSENVRFHTAMALQLIHEKKAFSCFCSDTWLEKKQKEANIANKIYKYDDACRNLPAELVIDNTSPFRIRINRDDVSNEIDSFIIMTQDKTPTYNFSCAVDDMLNDISIVIHDEEHRNNSLKQKHIHKLLNYEKKIEYINLPAILNESSKKITDDSNMSITWLLKEGFLPEAISNYLILMGNQTPKEIFTMKEALEWFDISKISGSPTHFDISYLKDINKKHLKNLDAKELSRYVGFADVEIGELARIYLDEATTTKELKSKIAPIFKKRDIPKAYTKEIELMVEVIKSAPYFEEYRDFKNHIMKEITLDDEDFLRFLRILLTNSENGPNIEKVYKYLKNYIGEIIK